MCDFKTTCAIISGLVVCDPNYLSRDAVAMFMDGGVARCFDFFSN